MANHPGRIPTYDTKRWNVAGHDSPSSYNGTLPDPPTLEYQYPLADPGKILNNWNFDRSRAMSSYRLAQIVCSPVLLEENAVWADDYTISEVCAIDFAVRSDA